MLAYYFPPGGGVGVQRSLKFVKYLPEFGWRPVVITADNPLGIPYDERLLDQVLPPTVVYRAKPWFSTAECFNPSSGFWTKLLNASLLIPDSVVPWVPPAVRLARQVTQREKVSLIYSTSPPDSTHLAAGWLKRQTGLPWVADFRDAWISDPDRNRSVHNRLRLATVEKWQERWVVQNADQIVTVSEPIRSDFMSRYPDLAPDKVNVITNGYDPEDLAGLERHPNAKFTFTFTGTLSKQHRDPAPLLEGARVLLDQRPDLGQAFQILLVGPHTQEQKELSERYRLSSVVRFIGSVPYTDSLSYQINADVNVIIYNGPKDGRSAQMVSGKIFEYLGASKPILVICPPEAAIAHLVAEMRAGVVVSPGSSADIARAMDDLIKGNYEASQESTGQFHRRYLTRQLATVFEAAGNRHKGK